MAAGSPIPPLSLSMPAVSGVSGSDGMASTGAFYWKRETGITATLERLAPLVLVGGLAWLAMR